MPYESRYERFHLRGPDGGVRAIELKRAGFLGSGDQPELYFFEVDGTPALVGLSGSALERFQKAGRHLSREEKVDIAGRWLAGRIEAGVELKAENLYVGPAELEDLARELGLEV